MIVVKQSDRVRKIVQDKYVRPAVAAGERRLSIRARDVLKDAEATADFPRGRTPLVCNVLQSKKLLKEAGLEIERVDGPESRQSRTVVVHYRVLNGTTEGAGPRILDDAPAKEDSKAWAERLTGRLRGLLKKELAENGGAEGFIRWIRSDELDPE